MKDRYYSFDAGGWHFVSLDNIQPRNTAATSATLDAEQQAWLEDDLAKNLAGERLPVCVVTHIPLCRDRAVLLRQGRRERTRISTASTTT